MASSHRLPAGSLVVRVGPTGEPFYEAKWRWQGAQVKRRVGPAWVQSDGDGGWVKRRGRVPEDFFDERRAVARMAALIAEHADELERADKAERERLMSFREVATQWLEWLAEVRQARPSTLQDYRYALAEPGAPHARGSGRSAGRIMKALGNRPINEITVRDISNFLRSLDREGLSPRNVNKHRQVLSAIFSYAMREDTFALPANPVTPTDKRREPPPAALDFFEPEEVEALARAAAEGRHRKPPVGRGGREMALGDEEIACRCAEDAQDAELFRVLAYTGMRIGEALALRWGDVDLAGRRLIVQRAVSGTEEGPPKSWQIRHLPLADPAHDALQRLGSRRAFTGHDDYVFCSRTGGRLDGSAVRERFHAARRAAGLRHIKLHGLRHGAGSLIARHTDAVFVQHFLGHSRLSTTERYMHAKARREDIERLNLAFGAAPTPSSPLATE